LGLEKGTIGGTASADDKAAWLSDLKADKTPAWLREKAARRLFLPFTGIRTVLARLVQVSRDAPRDALYDLWERPNGVMKRTPLRYDAMLEKILVGEVELFEIHNKERAWEVEKIFFVQKGLAASATARDFPEKQPADVRSETRTGGASPRAGTEKQLAIRKKQLDPPDRALLGIKVMHYLPGVYPMILCMKFLN